MRLIEIFALVSTSELPFRRLCSELPLRRLCSTKDENLRHLRLCRNSKKGDRRLVGRRGQELGEANLAIE